MKFVIGVDPGRSKVGLALLTASGELLERRIVTRAEASEAIRKLARTKEAIIALGDGTEAEALATELRNGDRLPGDCMVVMVDESDSTTEGRRLFLTENRGGLLTRLLPIGLRVPGRPWDDYVAEVIARRCLASIKHDRTLKDKPE